MRHSSFIQALVGLSLFVGVSCGVVVTVQLLRVCVQLRAELASIERITEAKQALTTEIYDRHGNKIGEFSDEDRYHTPIDQVPKHVIQAFLSAEDAGFYQHFGISIKAVLRSLVANLKGGHIKQGGSTITQQLARLYYLNQKKTLDRKLKEAILALAIERKHSKQKILELYLNKVYFGNRSYGIEAAARNYFRKHVYQLNIGEAALLAGLLKSPNHYAPNKHPKRAGKRQRFILKRMAHNGFIASEVAVEWTKRVIPVARHSEDHATKAPYFVAAVQDEIARKFEFEHLPREGLKIYTTLDAALQRSAARNLQNSVTKATAAIEKPASTLEALSRDALEGAVFSLDPQTGAVLAMQGGSNFTRSQFNRATAIKRRLGGAFLPVVLSLALERGYTLAAPVDFDPYNTSKNNRRPSPASTQASPPSLRDVLLSGDLTAASKLYHALGAGSVREHARKLGLTFDAQQAAPELGYGEANPAQLATAYAAFANNGQSVTPYLINHIENAQGKVLYRAIKQSPTPVLKPETAMSMRQLLREKLPANAADPLAGALAASSNDLHNTWFVGLSPQLVTCIWLGAENGQVRVAADSMQAARLGEDLWDNFMLESPANFKTAQSTSTLSMQSSKQEPKTAGR